MGDHSSSRDHAPTNDGGQGNPTLAAPDAGPTGWRCFRCDFYAADRDEAVKHFGPTNSWKPSCEPDADARYWRELAAREADAANRWAARAIAAETALRNGAPPRPPVTSDAVPGTQKETDQ